LEKTSKIIKSNHLPNTTMPDKPCPEMAHLHVFWTPPGMVTPQLPWAAAGRMGVSWGTALGVTGLHPSRPSYFAVSWALSLTGHIGGDFSLIASNVMCYEGSSLPYSCWQWVTSILSMTWKVSIDTAFGGCPRFFIVRPGASQEMASTEEANLQRRMGTWRTLWHLWGAKAAFLNPVLSKLLFF